MRVSRTGSISTSPLKFGSFHGFVIRPSPLVSITVGHQPCDACSSPVSSYSRVFNQPIASVEPLSQARRRGVGGPPLGSLVLRHD